MGIWLKSADRIDRPIAKPQAPDHLHASPDFGQPSSSYLGCHASCRSRLRVRNRVSL